jgi:hypothetical protein
MTRIQIELPDETAEAAQVAGLLSAPAVLRLFENALARHRAADYLTSLADEVREAGIAPMTMQEITAEVKAARQEIALRADRH